MSTETLLNSGSETSQEDGNYTARPIRLHLLRKDLCEENVHWDLELQVVSQDR
ncbi:MAG: hypothetical protein M1834_002122 [Cirrosporium novae-zelandiae]|nr:MAG: hypothetical protein M1834_002122 [Cirrosporium novae-zelandiae]